MSTDFSKYPDLEYEKLTDRLFVCVSSEHRFGTDAFLLAYFSNARHKDSVIDLCSGNGIVALAVEKLYEPREITAVELQDKAYCQLLMSKEKSNLLKLRCIHGDLREFKAEREADLVVCNPPYKISGAGIASQGKAQKIARHETECTIFDVCKAAARSLKYGGRLCVCNRPERLTDVLCAMRESGIEPKRLRLVSKNSQSAPWLMLCEGRKGGGDFMTVEPMLYMYDENGRLSEEVSGIYSNS